MHTHDGYAPHSHEVRADHLGVPKEGDPDYAAWMAKQSSETLARLAKQGAAGFVDGGPEVI